MAEAKRRRSGMKRDTTGIRSREVKKRTPSTNLQDSN